MTEESTTPTRWSWCGRRTKAHNRDGIDGILEYLDSEVEWRNPPQSAVAGLGWIHSDHRRLSWVQALLAVSGRTIVSSAGAHVAREVSRKDGRCFTESRDVAFRPATDGEAE
jgi:hypothetical protein